MFNVQWSMVNVRTGVHIHAPSLAMPKLKQVSLWSSGLAKTLDFIRPFLAMA